MSKENNRLNQMPEQDGGDQEYEEQLAAQRVEIDGLLQKWHRIINSVNQFGQSGSTIEGIYSNARELAKVIMGKMVDYLGEVWGVNPEVYRELTAMELQELYEECCQTGVAAREGSRNLATVQQWLEGLASREAGVLQKLIETTPAGALPSSIRLLRATQEQIDRILAAQKLAEAAKQMPNKVLQLLALAEDLDDGEWGMERKIEIVKHPPKPNGSNYDRGHLGF